MRARAYDRWNAMLAEYEAPVLDDAKREELADYVVRRKREIPEAWY
jgi:trimethylamine--corrinoid protein Co-methyltransferase